MTKTIYDSQRIQQEGRQFDKPSQKRCNKEESREGKASQSQYQKMSIEQRKAHNDRCKARRARLGIKNDSEYQKRWREANRIKANSYVKKSIAKRKITDKGFKAQCNLRKRFREIIATAKGKGSSRFNSLIGCSTKQLASHIESQFNKAMSWDNYGTSWHIDHILPCSSFDHNNPIQIKQCWHYTNLRPLCAKENIKKSNQITIPQMSLTLPFVW